MNTKLLKAKMDNFFDTVRPEKLIQDFEKMGYNFVDVKKQNLKNMYTVIYSKSPYLLARMATDLQMEGIPIANKWPCSEELNNPFDSHQMAVNHPELERLGISFWAIKLGFYNPIRHTLTSRNYLKVLGAIIYRPFVCKQ